MVLVNPVLAGSEFYQPSQSVNPTHVNPWSLPQQPVKLPTMQPEVQASEKYYAQPGAAFSSGVRNRDGRSHRGQFVTPEILKSLKQQQKQYQVMPDNTVPEKPLNLPYGSQQYRSPRSNSAQGAAWADQNNANTPVYGSPVYGAGSVNPLYGPPAVSPWGSGMDVLNHGESFPMIPSEAIGGFSPMHVPSFGMNNFKKDGSNGFLESDDIKVFNPFTFLPNSDKNSD